MKLEKEMLEFPDNIIKLIRWVRSEGRTMSGNTDLISATDSGCGSLAYNIYLGLVYDVL